MASIGLIAAMPEEIRPLIKRAGRVERLRLGAFHAFRFQVSDLDCLLVETGVGEQRAEAAARALLAAAAPSALISFGIAGAVEEDLHIGDVVSGRRVYSLIQGALGKPVELAALSPAAQQSAARALEPHRASLVSGTIVTTSGAQTIHNPPAELLHPVLEMETAGIARVAAEQGIPLLAVRAISDNPAEPIPFRIEDIYDGEYHQRTSRMIWTILRRPGLIPRLFRLARNAGKAEENAVIVVMAILDQIR